VKRDVSFYPDPARGRISEDKMRSIRKLGVALALAAALVAGGAIAHVRADTGETTTCPPARAYLCDVLAQTIEYLESLKDGPLRKALLARAQALYDRYCSTC